MAQGKIQYSNGPKLDWTQDHKSYDRFLDWKREVILLLEIQCMKTKPDAFKANLSSTYGWEKNHFHLSKCGKMPGDLRRTRADGAHDAAAPGNLPQTYLTKLDEFFKPKQNTMMAIREVWTNFQQGNEELNSWIARISNAIQLANYHRLPAGMTIKDRLSQRHSSQWL